jgi:hypothetical protein
MEKGLTANQLIAAMLREMADLLEQQGADGFRIAAYRRAAQTIDALEMPVEELARKGGLKALDELPAIGRGIAAAIMEMLTTGRWGQLERLKGSIEPENLFQTVPGIGPELASRIHDELDIDTLEALELAAHEGRLDAVRGIGGRRTAAIRAALGERLGRRRIKARVHPRVPLLEFLLDVDREYREKAASGRLRKIAPKRFNPTGEAWLPVLHTRRGDWQFTVLFSNTQLAHGLRKTRDWVVIYFQTDTEVEGQCTVVTESRGPLRGRRVVRGREHDCEVHYANGSVIAQSAPADH